MRSEYSTDDIRYLAQRSVNEFRKRGYYVEYYINTVVGKYGCVYTFENGMIYTTGLDSKDICAKKIMNLIRNIDEMVVKYCAVDNI